MIDNAIAPAAPASLQCENGSLWPTPTVTARVADADALNTALARIILAEEAIILSRAKPTAVAGITEGLTAQWLNYNVLNWPYPEIAMFREIVLTGLRQWLDVAGAGSIREVAGISCWANVLRYSERLTIHHHDPALVSAHYTVQSGFEHRAAAVPADSGCTVYFRPGFIDRSHGGDAALASSPWDDDWRIEKPAQPGRLFFFPSFVRHEVRPYLGDTQRISIALDVFLKRQRLPINFRGPRWFTPPPTE
jgi:hypothetical protein